VLSGDLGQAMGVRFLFGRPPQANPFRVILIAFVVATALIP
jgi:hypothetical protein